MISQGTKSLILGAVSAFLLGLLALLATAYFKEGPILALFMIVLPFLAAFALTRRAVDALLLTWLLEMSCGMSGAWTKVGPLSGRWLLFFIIAFAVAMRYLFSSRPRNPGGPRGIPLLTAAIFYMGFVFPTVLLIYSVFAMKTGIGQATGDIAHFWILLLYKPFRELIQRNLNLFVGWLIGSCLLAAGFLLFLTLGPLSITVPAYILFTGKEIPPITSQGHIRSAIIITVLPFVLLFLGTLLAIDRTYPVKARIWGVALALAGLAPQIANFVRGAILAIVLSFIIFFVALLITREYRALANRIFVVLIALVSIGVAGTFAAGPDAVAKFTSLGSGDSGVLGSSREHQVELTLRAITSEPIFGLGVGTPLPGYPPHSKTSFSMELQYHMMLYRFGVIAFATVLLAILWFFGEPFRLVRSSRNYLQPMQGKLAFSMLLSLLAVFIAGATNPYLTTSITVTFAVLFLASRAPTVSRPSPASPAT